MNIVKYLVLTVLIISIGKKTLFTMKDHQKSFTNASFPSGGWITDHKRHDSHGRVAKQENSSVRPVTNASDSDPQTTPKKYTRSTKTATMKDGSVYVGVVEYSQAVTPPNITIPALAPFAIIKNPKASSIARLGGQLKNITLWGLKVSGPKKRIKLNKKVIGYYWQESEIVQLNNGKTFVAIIQKPQGNYKPHDAHAIGPVWTQYSQDQIKLIAHLYKTSPSATNINPNGIGLVRIGKQKNILYGIALESGPALSSISSNSTEGTTQPLKQQSHISKKQVEFEADDQSNQGLNITAMEAVAAFYNLQR